MLSLLIYADSTRSHLLADWTDRVQPPRGGGFSFDSGEFGFASLHVPLVPMTQAQAFEVYSWPGLPDVVVIDQAGVEVWNGRIEDKRIVPGGVSITAFGYFRAFYDVPYTALWSKSGSGGWREVTTEDLTIAAPGRYRMDRNNRLYFELINGESYDQTKRGIMTYQLPHRGERDAHRISFDWNFENTTGVAFGITYRGYNESWTQLETESVFTSSSASGSGSYSRTLAAGTRFVTVHYIRNSATPHTYTGATGDTWARCTNIRITSSGATITGGEIARAVHDWLVAINPDQINDISPMIAATGPDLPDEIYEDQWPGDILKGLAERHDYEVGVFNDRRVHFWPSCCWRRRRWEQRAGRI
jgi:hypothetical protein